MRKRVKTSVCGCGCGSVLVLECAGVSMGSVDSSV